MCAALIVRNSNALLATVGCKIGVSNIQETMRGVAGQSNVDDHKNLAHRLADHLASSYPKSSDRQNVAACSRTNGPRSKTNLKPTGAIGYLFLEFGTFPKAIHRSSDNFLRRLEPVVAASLGPGGESRSGIPSY